MKKYVFFLFFLLQACKRANTAAVSNDFYQSWQKVWCLIWFIGEYQTVRFEPNQGGNSSFADLFY